MFLPLFNVGFYIFFNLIDSDSDDDSVRTITPKPKLPSFVSTNKIHSLCLLPSIGELVVSPKEFALSKVYHTTDAPGNDESILPYRGLHEEIKTAEESIISNNR